MSTCFKFLDVKNYQILGNEVYDYLNKRTNLLRTPQPLFFNELDVKDVRKNVKSVREWLTKNRLVAKRFIVIIVPPGNQPDNLHFDRLVPYVRILWPIRNCENSVTKFFNADPANAQIAYLENNIPYYRVDEFANLRMIDQFELSSPLVFDSGIAHSVHPAPNATKTRISFSIGFDEDLQISQSVDRWSNFYSEIS
jgi:hypothetical protein